MVQALKRKDMLGLEEMSAENNTLIPETACSMREIMLRKIKKVPTLPLVLEKLSTAPAQILQVSGGDLQPGSTTDLILIDLKHDLSVNPDRWYSKASNTLFASRSLTIAAAYSFAGGQVVMKRGVVAEVQSLLR